MKTRELKFFYGYVVVLAGFFIMVMAWGTLYTFGVFFKPLATEFGWTRAMTSGAYSLSMALHGLSYIVTGRLTDRFGPKVVITVCGCFLGLGYLLMSHISVAWHLYLVYGVIIAIGMSGSYVPLVSTIARCFIKRRGMMTGIVVSGAGIGTMIMPPLAEWLISTYGWRTSYTIIGVMVLVFIILAAQFLRHNPSQVGQQSDGSDKVREDSPASEVGGLVLRQAIQVRQFWMLGGALFCQGYCIQAIMVHIVPHITDLGTSAIIAASVLTIIGGANLPSKIIMGSLVDRVGSRTSFVVGLILMSVVLLWLPVAKEMWMVYLFAVAFGFAYGGLIPIRSPMVAELFGLRSHGIILGIVTFSSTIGGAAGPTLTGYIFDTSGNYQLAFWVCATLCIISLVQVWFLKPTISQKRSK